MYNFNVSNRSFIPLETNILYMISNIILPADADSDKELEPSPVVTATKHMWKTCKFQQKDHSTLDLFISVYL